MLHKKMAFLSKNARQKVFTGLLALSVLFSNIGLLLVPKKAAAVIPVQDTPLFLLTAKIAGLDAVEAKFDLFKWLQEFALSTLKKRVLDVMVDQVVASIQGGGKPQFVTDWKGFLQDASQAAIGDFAQEFGAGFLCAPFSFQLQLSLLKVPKFSQKATCTLDKIVKNIQEFRNDFRKGGWVAFGASWQPQNNFYGALIMALQELEIRKEAAAFAAQNEAQAGGGFLSTKKCDIDPVTGKEVRCKVTTPGSAVGGVVTKALGADFDFIVNAQQLGEYVGAIVNALINRLFTEGLAAVKGTSNKNILDTATISYNQVTANAFIQNKQILLDKIDSTLTPRQQGQVVVDTTVQNLVQYQEDLQKLYSDFSSLSKQECLVPGSGLINVSSEKGNILTEVANASTTISQISAGTADNKAIVDKLTPIRAEMAALPATETGLARVAAIDNEISGSLDSDAAIAFRAAADVKADEVNADIKAKLDAFNKDLRACR